MEHATSATVINMKEENVKPKAKKERERIRCIEERPQPDWFVQCKGPDGQTWWFLRLSITGLKTRRYGPFATRTRALLFLDRIIGGPADSSIADSSIFDCITDADNNLSDYAIRPRRFECRFGFPYSLIESELIRHAPSILPKEER